MVAVLGLNIEEVKNLIKNFNNLIDNKLNIFDSSNLIKGIINFRHKNIDIHSKINSKITCINIDDIKKKNNQ